MTSKFVTGYQGFFNPSQAVSIAASGTDSEVINCGGFVLTGISLPTLFTGTALSFLVGDTTDGFQATGSILFADKPTNGDTLTINDTVITFVDATPTGNEVLIGADGPTSAALLQTFLAASLDAGLAACTYATNGALTIVTAIVHGTAGNAYTFAKSASVLTLTPSGGTLGGGGFRPLYNSSNSLVSMTVGAGRCYAVDPANFQGVRYLKIKSGSSETAARSLICSLKGF